MATRSMIMTTAQPEPDKGVRLAATAIPNAVPKQVSLKRMALIGSAWTIGSMILGQGMRLASNLILVRLVDRELIGIMTLMNVFLMGLEMFSDIGISHNIVQSKRGEDRDFLNTAWTLQVIRGGVLWLGCCGLAWPVAWYYDQAIILYALPVLGLSAVVQGFYNTSFAERQRKLAIGPITVCGLISQVSGITTMLVWAYISPTVWAMVANGLVSSVVIMMFSHTILAERLNRFHIDRESFQELFRFGRWIFLSTILTYFILNTDQLFIGRVVGVEMLGVYSIALVLSKAVEMILGKLLHVVVLPALSQVNRDSPDRLRDTYYRVRLRLDLIAMPVCGGLAIAGGYVVRLLYPETYYEAGWMLQLLAVRSAMSILISCADNLQYCQGKSNYSFIISSIRFSTLVIALPIGYRLNGLSGLIWGMVLMEIAPFVYINWINARHKIWHFQKELRAVGLFMVGLGLGWVVTLLLSSFGA